MTENDRLSWIYASKNSKELAERYDQWAESYDEELNEDYGWQIPRVMAELLSRFTPVNGRILDAGAGTGLVGQYLSSLGFENLVAIDISNEMLNRAREKGVYREFHVMDLGEMLNFPDHFFDAVVCAGVLTFSHAPARSLNEMVRVTKSGGHILYSIRTDAYESLGLDAVNSGLESNNKWKLMEKKSYQSFSRKEQDVIHDIRVYQVL
jgi:predicted TPR repeat methyltransferase